MVLEMKGNEMKLAIKMIVLGIALTFGVASNVGCDPCDSNSKIHAKYDAMTGERLPEKVDHFKDAKVEVKDISDGIFFVRLVRCEIEGHVYYSRHDSDSSWIHAASCPCRTNMLSNAER